MEKHLAYAAGYIDGDGCFFINKITRPIKYRSQLIISSTNATILEFFKLEFGGSVYPVYTKCDHWKQSFHWIIRGRSALEFSKKIKDFIIDKSGDISIFIDYISQPSQSVKQELIHKMRCHRDEIRTIDSDVVKDVKAIPFVGVKNDLDYPYLAGFIDAECCLGISTYKPRNRPNKTYKISLRCNDTSPIIFFWLMERFGGSITHIKRHHKNPKHRDQISWCLTGKALYPVLNKLYPYLRAKKPVCQKLIELHETIIPNGGDRQSDAFRTSYGLIMAKRDLIVDEVHKLNSKGVSII